MKVPNANLYTKTKDKVCCLFDIIVVYGQVTRMLGSGRLEVYCFDGQTRLAHIRGKLRKKVNWFNLTWVGLDQSG